MLVKKIAGWPLALLTLLLYVLGYLAHKVALVPGWIHAALRTGWDDAK